jgi:hypothetical protein
MPERILDLFVEFRNRTNGLPVPAGSSLLGALTYFGLDGMAAVEKREIQEAIGQDLWRGRFAPNEILDYCETDVAALTRLLSAMLPEIDLPRALLRGRHMAAAAAMEYNGTPIDTEMLARLRLGWSPIQDELIADIDRDYHVYVGRTFKLDRFAKWLAAAKIPWPRLESGQLDLSDSTFRQMSRVYPQVSPLQELRSSLDTVFGWHIHVGQTSNPRSLRNFPAQANGAEMMRLAACLATERGIEVCAPVHDAFLICAPLDRLDQDITAMQSAMAEASRIVLGGFELGTDVAVTRWPDRYMDIRGRVMWGRVTELLDRRDLVRTAG